MHANKWHQHVHSDFLTLEINRRYIESFHSTEDLQVSEPQEQAINAKRALASWVYLCITCIWSNEEQHRKSLHL